MTTDRDAQFDALLERIDTTSGFGHRQHVHLTWLAVREHDLDDATAIVTHGLRRLAREAQVPRKFHLTMSRAWVLLIAHHVDADGDGDFTAFIQRNQALLDPRLLARFYRPASLASEAARTTWVEPDLAPLPGAVVRAGLPAVPGLGR